MTPWPSVASPPHARAHSWSLDWQQVDLASRRLRIAQPDDPDSVINAAIAEGSDPYWATIWPAAQRMAEQIHQRTWPAEQRALELGCGLGLVGIAAGLAGLHVTLTDNMPDAVALASENLQANGISGDARLLDWSWLPDNDVDSSHGQSEPAWPKFDILLGCDLVYDTAAHAALLNAAAHLLADDGTFWLGDPGRANLTPFLTDAQHAGWQIDHIETGLWRLSKSDR